MNLAIGRILLAGWLALVLPGCGTIRNMTEDIPGGSPFFFGGVGYDVLAIRAKPDPEKLPERERKAKAALAALDLPLSAAADTALTATVVCAAAFVFAQWLKGDSEDDTSDVAMAPSQKK